MATVLKSTPDTAAAVSASKVACPVFVPHGQVGEQPNIIVDGAPLNSTVLTLSHWPNNQTPEELKRDTSTATVFAYLDRPDLHVSASIVSNNHFDEDGLFSMFALCEPEIALAHRELLIDASLAGDFGIVRSRDAARLCFAIEGFADPAVSPLPSAVFDGCERLRSANLYAALLSRLPEILDDIESFRPVWEGQEQHFDASRELIENGSVSIEDMPELDLAVVRIPTGLADGLVRRYIHSEYAPVHPFAIHSVTDSNRIITAQGQRLQMQYRYESWVQLVSRRPRLRADLAGLADRLNEVETAPGTWRGEPVTEVAPRLYLEGARESGVAADTFIDMTIEYLLSAPVAWDPYDWHGEESG